MREENILKEKLKEIDLVIKDHYNESTDIGVLSGISGIALFQFYYAKYTGEEIHADLGAAMLSEVIEKINEGYSFPTFCAGIAGGAWAIEHATEEGFIDVDCDALLSDLDDFLMENVTLTVNENFFDFLHGIQGIGFYFLKRYQNTKSDGLREKYKRNILHIVERLASASIPHGDTVKWESYLSREEDLKGFNIGLSHGMSSIVNFLSRLVSYNDFKAETESLLKKAVNFIISIEYNNAQQVSCFPDWITSNNEKSDSCRLGWCYGDLGIALSLWRAGQVLEDTSICDKAILVMKKACKRTTTEETRINDAGLCHGSYGVMHIFNYMYKETGDDIFKEASEYWMQESLAMAVHDNGHAGYMQWRGGEDAGWRNEINLLEGVSGIGLAILSYLAPFETKWDECLLIG